MSKNQRPRCDPPPPRRTTTQRHESQAKPSIRTHVLAVHTPLCIRSHYPYVIVERSSEILGTEPPIATFPLTTSSAATSGLFPRRRPLPRASWRPSPFECPTRPCSGATFASARKGGGRSDISPVKQEKKRQTDAIYVISYFHSRQKSSVHQCLPATGLARMPTLFRTCVCGSLWQTTLMHHGSG